MSTFNLNTEYWWGYGQFRWSREQNIWVIQNYYLFHEGMWPPEPKEYRTDEYVNKKWVWIMRAGGSIDGHFINRRGFSSEAYFCKPKEIISEIELRLKLTKTDGKLLMSNIWGGIGEYENLDSEAKNALNYISISDFRKRPNYATWKAKRRYRNIPH